MLDPVTRTFGASRRVMLVCPPFQHHQFASLATARLATHLQAEGVECVEAYLHFALVRLMGEAKYQQVTAQGLDAELLFAEGLHGSLSKTAEVKLAELFGDRANRQALLSEFWAVCLERLNSIKPTLVGITTSNHQLMAALWLSRCVKEFFPQTLVVLGGSSCSEPMGRVIADTYAHVDCVVSGYGEAPLLALALGQAPSARLLINRERPAIDQLPVPNYFPFLREAREFDDPMRIRLEYEGSRGCWWGARTQCSFCGLSGQEIHYEEKPSAQVVKELSELWDNYHRYVFATDLVLSPRHLEQAIPALSSSGEGPPLFYEVRANLTREQVFALARANVREAQPGIESLSTRLLRMLRKGTNRLQSVTALKHFAEAGIYPHWNLLCGIPGELEADYDEQIRLMHQIPHLTPPSRVNQIRIDRYSPYFESFEKYGWTAIEPAATYRLLHPHLTADQVHDVAYHFTGLGGVSSDGYRARLDVAIADWRRRHQAGEGLFRVHPQVLERLAGTEVERIELDITAAAILDVTEDIVSVEQLVAKTGASSALIQELVGREVLLLEDGRATNLAIDRTSRRA